MDTSWFHSGRITKYQLRIPMLLAAMMLSTTSRSCRNISLRLSRRVMPVSARG